jgi:hypothetical protein
MPISNYPNGFANGMTIRGIPLQQSHPGEVFWVNSTTVLAKGGIGSSDGNKGTYQQPFATIDYAISKCTASRGDIIMVMPGHTETITTDGGIACDVAGVAIVGLGSGSLRPKVILDTAAAAAVTVSAANVTLHNIIFEASFADVTNAIDVTAAYATISQCHFQEEGADLNFVDYIVASSTTDNNADGLAVVDCSGYGIDAAINSPLLINADLQDLVFENNRFNTDNANALAMIQVATGKDLNNCYVVGNFYASLKTSGDILIDNDTTANDGWVAHNRAIHLDTAGEVLVDCDGVGLFENYATGVVTASGYLLPAADS